MSLYKKNTPEVATISLPPLMPTNNDGETTNREDFTDPIQLNDSPNNNYIFFTTGVYNQKPITYKHPNTLLFLQLLYHILVQDNQIKNIVYFT